MAALKCVLLIFTVSHCAAVAMVIDSRGARDWISATQDSCKDCTEVLNLFADMISDSDTEANIFILLERLCHQLPGSMAQELCLGQVKQNLPTVVQFLTDVIKTNRLCTILGACKSQSQGMEQVVLTNAIAEIHATPEPGKEISSTGQCTFCVFLFNSLVPWTETPVQKGSRKIV